MLLRISNRGLLMVLVISLGGGCEDKSSNGPVAKKAAPQEAVPDAPKEPAPPWFAGSWSGTAQLKSGPQTLEIDRAERSGKEAPTASDALKTFELNVEITSLREVSGKARLGAHELAVRGVLDEGVLRLKLAGHEAQATFIAGRAREAEPLNKFEGTVSASLIESEEGKVLAHTFTGPMVLERSK